jgi:hypothetical protein
MPQALELCVPTRTNSCAIEAILSFSFWSYISTSVVTEKDLPKILASCENSTSNTLTYVY